MAFTRANIKHVCGNFPPTLWIELNKQYDNVYWLREHCAGCASRSPFLDNYNRPSTKKVDLWPLDLEEEIAYLDRNNEFTIWILEQLKPSPPRDTSVLITIKL